MDRFRQPDVTLVPASDEHFQWMLGERTFSGLRLPPEGVDNPAVLSTVRAKSATLNPEHRYETWMIVCGQEVVGLCGFKGPADACGIVEIGYGVTATRRGQGYATAAIRELLTIASRRRLKRVIARVSPDNPASQVVLERNGFSRQHPARDEGTSHEHQPSDVLYTWDAL